MQTLNVDQDRQARIIVKVFGFTQTRSYNAKLHDPNKKKMGLPGFEQMWRFYGIPYFLFFVQNNAKKVQLDESDFRHSCGNYFEISVLNVT